VDENIINIQENFSDFKRTSSHFQIQSDQKHLILLNDLQKLSTRYDDMEARFGNIADDVRTENLNIKRKLENQLSCFSNDVSRKSQDSSISLFKIMKEGQYKMNVLLED
jgi:hypothetical protein